MRGENQSVYTGLSLSPADFLLHPPAVSPAMFYFLDADSVSINKLLQAIYGTMAALRRRIRLGASRNIFVF